MMLLLAAGILLIAIAFIVGVALTVMRSPNRNPLEALNATGLETSALVTAIEDDGDEPNIVVEYVISDQKYSRSIPWPPNRARPNVGDAVRIRYLPTQPGLSRLV
jgi:hypothetical protein